MSKPIFKVNQHIEVVIQHGPYTGHYNSRVEDVTKDTIEIAIPSKRGHLLPLSEQTWFIGKIVDTTCLYTFKARIFQVALKKSVPTWIIEMPQEVEKTQRRLYIRRDSSLPVFLKIVPSGEHEVSIAGRKYSPEELETKIWEMATKDISGSGAKLISKWHIPEGTNVDITIVLPEVGDFDALGKVVRSELVNPEIGLYWVGMHYTDLSERERDKIIRFVFKKQIELRKRNLL
jgi:c-di-GMP-binding flagellar brake protein YcgR